MENARGRVPSRSGANGGVDRDQLGYQKESRFAKQPHAPDRFESLDCIRGNDKFYAPAKDTAPENRHPRAKPLGASKPGNPSLKAAAHPRDAYGSV